MIIMTAKDIERDMKQFVSGSSFITPGKLAQYLGQKNTTRVKKKYLSNVFSLEGTKSYFIPDVARSIYAHGDWMNG